MYEVDLDKYHFSAIDFYVITTKALIGYDGPVPANNLPCLQSLTDVIRN